MFGKPLLKDLFRGASFAWQPYLSTPSMLCLLLPRKVLMTDVC